MNLTQALATRRTARAYAEAPVPFEAVEELVRSAAQAPSACNRRGWRCILVQDPADLDWLYRRGGSAVFRTASQVLLVCYESGTENREWQDTVQSAAAFIAYFQLVAHDRGIGSCWLCHLPPKRQVADYFSVPAAYEPVAAVSFGFYRNGDHGVRPDRPDEKLLALGRWAFAAEPTGHAPAAAGLRRLCRRIYYALPFRGFLRGVAGRFEKRFDE